MFTVQAKNSGYNNIRWDSRNTPPPGAQYVANFFRRYNHNDGNVLIFDYKPPVGNPSLPFTDIDKQCVAKLINETPNLDFKSFIVSDKPEMGRDNHLCIVGETLNPNAETWLKKNYDLPSDFDLVKTQSAEERPQFTEDIKLWPGLGSTDDVSNKADKADESDESDEAIAEAQTEANEAIAKAQAEANEAIAKAQAEADEAIAKAQVEAQMTIDHLHGHNDYLHGVIFHQGSEIEMLKRYIATLEENKQLRDGDNCL